MPRRHELTGKRLIHIGLQIHERATVGSERSPDFVAFVGILGVLVMTAVLCVAVGRILTIHPTDCGAIEYNVATGLLNSGHLLRGRLRHGHVLLGGIVAGLTQDVIRRGSTLQP